VDRHAAPARGPRSANAVASVQKMMLVFTTEVSAVVQGYSGSVGGGR
jgi:hypothetical protein